MQRLNESELRQVLGGSPVPVPWNPATLTAIPGKGLVWSTEPQPWLSGTPQPWSTAIQAS